MRCHRPGCSWEAIAPSRAAAREQYAEHLVEAHATTVEADVPEGMVQVKSGDADEWTTVTVEEARRLHGEHHEGRRGDAPDQ